MRYIFAFLTLLITTTTLLGQLRQIEHVELEIDPKHGSNYQLIQAGQEGVLCLLESQKLEKNNNIQLKFFFYDTDLHQEWEQGYLINSSAKILSTAYDEGFIYILVQTKEFEYSIMKLSLKDGIISQIAFTDIQDFLITHFEASHGTLLMGGTIKNTPAVILKRYDKDNKPIVLPSINQLKSDLIDLVIDEKREEIVVLLDKKRPIGERAIYVNRYSYDGNIEKNSVVQLSSDFNLITYRPHMADDGSLLLFGSYGMKTETLAQGIYSLRIKNGKLAENRFYDFGYLKNFFNYLPTAKRERYLKKIRQKFEEGSRKRFGYKLFVHDLQVSDNRIIFSAESYDPQNDYRRYDAMASAAGGTPYFYPSARNFATSYSNGYLPSAFSRDARRFSDVAATEYKYTHAFVLGFNKSGKLLWDNSYTFDDTEMTFPIELTQVAVTNDTLAFLQYDEEKYHFKMAHQSDYQEDNTSIDIPEVFPGDEQKDFEHGGMMRWFGNNFLISGMKKFDNKRDNDQKRKVFFISKYTFNSGWVDEPAEEDEKGKKTESDGSEKVE